MLRNTGELYVNNIFVNVYFYLFSPLDWLNEREAETKEMLFWTPIVTPHIIGAIIIYTLTPEGICLFNNNSVVNANDVKRLYTRRYYIF